MVQKSRKLTAFLRLALGEYYRNAHLCSRRQCLPEVCLTPAKYVMHSHHTILPVKAHAWLISIVGYELLGVIWNGSRYERGILKNFFQNKDVEKRNDSRYGRCRILTKWMAGGISALGVQVV